MNVYKDFIQHLRRLTLDEVLIVSNNVTPKLMEYVYILTNIKFEDGSYETFYGDVKKTLCSYISYFTQAIGEVIKDADRWSNEITKHELVDLIEKTISIHQKNQIDFGNAFLPITSQMEKNVYEDIERQYNDYLKKLYEFKEKIDVPQKPEKVLEFAKTHFEIMVKKTSDLFNFTYDYLALILVDSLNKIRTSLEEIHQRLNNNLIKMQYECEETLNGLMSQLYDKNKENLFVNRADKRSSVQLAEVSHSIQVIRNKIETFESEASLTRLEEEVEYWKDRLEDFNEVALNLVKLKVEQDNVTREHDIYKSMRSTELPGQKRVCWETMEENFIEQKAYVKQKMLEEARAMVTFFACRGTDRIFYTDNIGPYYLDEFNHQVYVFDFGLGIYHVGNNGNFNTIPDNPHYFDKNGRYIYQNNEKLYQCAPCTSLYNLQDNNLLVKLKDCSSTLKKGAQVAGSIDFNMCDLQKRRIIRDVSILPVFPNKDITSTLDAETVKYLWDSFGSILPDALHDVGKAASRNPIHYLAHKLLYHKYKRDMKELSQKKTEAEEYRANIYKERKEKAVAQSMAWKSKQVRRRKPEESDDTQERAVYDAHIAQQDFINAINNYDI